MTVKRQQVGAVEHYRGHAIRMTLLGPDLLCYVDGVELQPFYETVRAARAAAEHYIDQVEEEKSK